MRNTITRIVIDCLHEENEKNISKISIDEIVDYLYLIHIRNKKSFLLQPSQFDSQIPYEFPITYETSNKITQRLTSRLHFIYDGEDVLFLVILLMSYRISNISFAKEERKKELITLANECIFEVQKKMGFKNSIGSSELRMDIVRYLRSFQLRNKYHIILRLDTLSYVKMRRNYLLALDLSYLCLEYLYYQYGYMLNEDEILYLMPSFVKIQSQLRKPKKLNVLVISSSGILFANLIVDRLKKDFSDYFQSIQIKEYYLLESQDLKGIDFIISDLSKQDLNLYEVPICQIHGVMDDLQDRIDMLTYLSRFNKRRLCDLCKKEQFFHHWQVKHKNDLFFHLVNLLDRTYHAQDKLLLLRMLVRRENTFSYECGNHTAIISLFDPTYIKEKVFLVILPKPIIWKKEIVQIIFIHCFAQKDFENNLFILEETCQISQNYNLITSMIDQPEYDYVMSLLQNESQRLFSY